LVFENGRAILTLYVQEGSFILQGDAFIQLFGHTFAKIVGWFENQYAWFQIKA